jgi:hypothetical protein
MARQRQYQTNAERQAAYRQRRRDTRRDSRPEFVLMELHEALKDASGLGDALASLLVGENPIQTSRNIASHFNHLSSSVRWSKLQKL